MQLHGLVRHLGVGAAIFCFSLAACGDDDGGTGTIDARPSGTPDAGTPDAAPTNTHSGTVSVQDISILGAPTAGHGGQITIAFGKTGVPTEMMAGSTATPPCYATLTDVTKSEQSNPDLDEGTVKIEVKMAGGGTRPLPDCTFVGDSYRCVSGMGASATTAAIQAPVYSFNGTGTGAAAAGHYAIITSGAGAGLAMPVVAGTGTMLTVVSSMAAPPETTGTWITAAGIGPIPPVPGVAPTPPEFLADDDTVKVSMAGGTDFAAIATGDFEVGKAFELSDATVAMIAGGIDLDSTSALAFSCKKVGAACPAAVGTIVTLDTTDATSFPGGPSDLGTPVKYTGALTCAAFGDEVSVGADLLAVLKAGAPTKMRITVLRVGFSPISDTTKKNAVNVVAGHGIVAFQEGNF